MRSQKFSLSKFADTVSDLTPGDIYRVAQEEMEQIKQITKPGRRGAPAAREAGAQDYMRQLKRLCYCLTSLSEPGGATAYEIGIYKALFAHAVELGVLPAAKLPQFLR